jgi:DNA-binding LacI/PurR family transcriptional regulator
MGRQAAATLIERIDNPDAPAQRIVLKTELIVRETCGVAASPEP